VTLVEFLASLPAPRTNRNRILATLYYLKRYEGVEAATVETIRKAMTQARVSNARNMNIARDLSNSGADVDSPGSEDGKRLWKLTDTGEKSIREMLGLPEAEPELEHDVSALSSLAQGINDEIVKGYVEEAILCMSVGALRAAIVFLWTAAIRTLHEEAMTLGAKAVTAAVQKHDPKARSIGKVDDFAYVKDKTFLLAAQDLGLIDKGERDTLQENLDLRNRCGHPTQYKPRESKARGFVEDIIGIVFT
jgi:hypothetical protein